MRKLQKEKKDNVGIKLNVFKQKKEALQVWYLMIFPSPDQIKNQLMLCILAYFKV